MDDLFRKNIFMLESNYAEIDMPDNLNEIKKEIVLIIKKNNLSLSQSAMIFDFVIKNLGCTPINEL